MNTLRKFWIAILAVAIVLGMTGCKQDITPPANETDTTPPANVTNLAAASDDTTVTLTWTDAADADIFGYEITCTEAEATPSRAIATMDKDSVFVAQGVGAYKAAGLADGKTYTFTVKSMDKSGNKSSGVTANATITKDHTHTFATAWTWNDTHHWHDSDCGHSGYVSDYGEHEFGEWATGDDGATRRKCGCGYEQIASLKGYSSEYEANLFQAEIKKTGATVGYSSNVKKVVFALLSDNDAKAAIEKEDVKATKQDVGTADGAYYAYYDSGEKTLYIVPSSENATKFTLNENSSRLFYDFRICTEIKGFELVDTSNVTNMSYMFEYCSALAALDVSKFDTSNVTNMSYMFYNCSALTELDVSKFDTSNVTNMSYMFEYCSALTALDVSKFDTSNVTNMSCMFYNCSALTELDLSTFDTSNVTNMSCMFEYCSALTALDVSKFDTSNVTNMSCMFEYCSALTALDVSKFDTSNVTNMSYMFASSGLTALDVSKFDTSNVTNMNYMFEYCSALTTIYVKDKNTFVPSGCSDYGVFYYCGVTNKEGLTNIADKQ